MGRNSIDENNNTSVYILEAIRRHKENPDFEERCIRRVVRDETTIAEEIEVLQSTIKYFGEGGIWRIYRTVNRRDCKKAYMFLLHRMVDNLNMSDALKGSSFSYSKIESIWKTCLCKPECNFDHNFLLDIDTTDEKQIQDVLDYLYDKIENKLFIFVNEVNPTPNGMHVVTNRFDTRELLEKFPFVTLNRDGLLFLKMYKS